MERPLPNTELIYPDADRAIYLKWCKAVVDNRYLRADRWKEIRRILVKNKVKTVLEFGAGVSSALFDNLKLKVDSYETDAAYLELVKPFCSPNVTFHIWNGIDAPVEGMYDFALVDGILPRKPQMEIALKHAKIIALDDSIGEIRRSLLPLLEKYPRIDLGSTIIAIYKIV